MKKLLATLNPNQRAAATAGEGPLLVLAGAGTGKTRVIIARIVHLIESGVSADRICAITFTNKAAREMEQRLLELRKNLRPRPSMSTFHALGLRILRAEHARAGLRARFPLYDEGDVRGVLIEIVRELAGMRAADEGLEHARRAISFWKSRFVAPDQAVDEADEDASYLHARAYARYDERMRALSAVDFDDLIFRPVVLLEQDPVAQKNWVGRFEHVLVDEYQDSNTAQYRFARLLTGTRENLAVVGDDDQSIYAFRGAEVEKILAFRSDFPRARVVTLEENYRSMARILEAANAVIKNNSRRHPKQLRAVRGEGALIPYLTFENEEEEAAGGVREIVAARERGLRFSEQAVLMRSALQSRPFEEKLRFERIPYTVVGGQSYFERREIRDLISYLRLLVAPEDDIALLRILNTPRRGFGKESREKLDDWSRAQRVPVATALERLGEIDGLTAAARAGGAGLCAAIRSGARAIAEGGSVIGAVRAYLEEVRFADALREYAADATDYELRRRGADQLIDSVERATNAGSLAEFLDGMALDSKLTESTEQQRDELALMTFHSAKGLEFRQVIIAGVEEDLIPHKRALGEGGDRALEEERRLFYVALTRARDALILSRAAERRRFGRAEQTTESRYVAEIPEHLLDRRDMTLAAAPEVGAAGAAAHLARLRARLDQSN